MFNKKLNNRTNTGERLTRGLVPALVAAAGLAIAAPATAQDWEEHYEWEPGTGYHEEEWYDPTDWFDDDFYNTGIDYEETGYDWWRDGDEAWSPGYDNDYYADYDGDRSYWENRDGEPNARYDYTWSGWDDASGQRRSQTTDSDFYTDEDDPVDYDYWDSRRDYDYTSQANQQDRQRMIQNAELRGRLDGWQRRNLQGQKDAHTLVRIRMENGRSAIVNLGPNVELSRLDLQDGDRIAVAGKHGTIDGKDVLMAQKVRTGDKIVRMNNWEPQQQSNRDRMQREYDRQRRMQAERQRQMQYERQMRAEHQQRMQDQRRSGSQVRGKLENWQRVDLEGQKDAHTLVRLRMDDGRSAIVNFGPNVELSRLDLEQGDHVAVRGMPGSINDKDVLMAQYVQVIDSTTIRMDNWDPTGKDGSGSTQSKAKQKSGQSEQSE